MKIELNTSLEIFFKLVYSYLWLHALILQQVMEIQMIKHLFITLKEESQAIINLLYHQLQVYFLTMIMINWSQCLVLEPKLNILIIILKIKYPIVFLLTEVLKILTYIS
jgi:hypothetical protein